MGSCDGITVAGPERSEERAARLELLEVNRPILCADNADAGEQDLHLAQVTQKKQGFQCCRRAQPVVLLEELPAVSVTAQHALRHRLRATTALVHGEDGSILSALPARERQAERKVEVGIQ